MAWWNRPEPTWNRPEPTLASVLATIRGDIRGGFEQLSRQLERWGRAINMKIDQFQKEVDEGTTAAGQRVDEQGQRITELIASIKESNGTLTPEQEAKAAAITSNLSALGSHLADIGKDKENPVPPAPPLETT